METEVENMDGYIARSMEKTLGEMAEHFPVVVLSGARQTGKTTLARRWMEGPGGKAGYVTLDHPKERELARRDPELFLQEHPEPAVIDEVQYAPELFPHIKMRVDAGGGTGRYVLTGSQLFRLMRNAGESLAGRAGLLTLHGLTRAEREGYEEEPFLPGGRRMTPAKGTETERSLFETILRGGMPKLAADPGLSAETYFAGYVQTYLERDIRDLRAVKDEGKFFRFLGCAAARTGQELNLSELGRDAGVDMKTAEQWVSLLVTSGLAFLLQPWSGNTTKRFVKRPKLYFLDTGLACYLSLWNDAGALSRSAMAGAMMETHVVGEVVKELSNRGRDARSRLAYYRDHSGREIDLLVMEGGMFHPVEIKKSAEPGKDAVRHFKALEEAVGAARVGEGAVVCLAGKGYVLDGKNRVVPVGEV